MALPLLASGLPQFRESCCPCGLHCVISGLLAGGSPGFRSVLCWFLYSQSSCKAAFVIVACFVLFGLTAIPIPRMIPWMIQCYHLSSSYRRCELTSWSPCLFCFVVCGCLFVLFLLLVLVGFLFCLFVLFGFFLLASWQLIGLCTGPTSVQLLKPTFVKMDDVFALIHRICQYATGLPAWWTTWRKLWGVGWKKSGCVHFCIWNGFSWIDAVSLLQSFPLGDLLQNGTFKSELDVRNRRFGWNTWTGLQYLSQSSLLVMTWYYIERTVLYR